MGMGTAAKPALPGPGFQFPEPLGRIVHNQFGQVDIAEPWGIHNVAPLEGQQFRKAGGMPAPADFGAYLACF